MNSLNQGDFGSCVSHAFVVVIVEQLKHRYDVAIQMEQNITSVIEAVDGFSGALVEHAAERITNGALHGHGANGEEIRAKPVRFLNTVKDKYYTVKIDAGKQICDYDEFAALVAVSSGFCRAVAVVSTRVRGQGDHVVAARSVQHGSFSIVECINSWGDSGGATLKCTRKNFDCAYFLDVDIAEVLVCRNSILKTVTTRPIENLNWKVDIMEAKVRWLRDRTTSRQCTLISESSLTISDQTLGVGATAKVWRGKLRGVGDVAVKEYDIDADNPIDKTDFVNEVSQMASMSDHANVVQCLGCSVEGSDEVGMKARIVMEYMGGGTLRRSLVNSRGDLGDVHLRLLLEVARGMQHVHQQNVVHGDLKSSNVLLTSHESPQAKVADFGSSHSLVVRHSVRPSAKTMPANESGTWEYWAPERWAAKGPATHAEDSYACGMIMYEIQDAVGNGDGNGLPWNREFAEESNRRTPEDLKEFIRAVVKKGRRPGVAEFTQTLLPSGFVALMKQCWSKKPNKRPTFQEIINGTEGARGLRDMVHLCALEALGRAWGKTCPIMKREWPADGDPRKDWKGLTLTVNDVDVLMVETVNLHNNQLTCVPVELGALTALTVLDLSGNQLTTVPAELGQLTKLVVLNLHRNQLIQLPVALNALTSLNELTLNNNQLTHVPAEFGRFTALTTLHLHANDLTQVPAELGALTALTSLTLGKNPLIRVPAEVEALTALVKSQLLENKLSTLSMECRAAFTSMTQRELKLNNKHLTHVPSGLGVFTALKKLYLHENLLTSVPAALPRALTKLTELYLGMNELTSLPAELGALNFLTHLDLYDNKLESLPAEIGTLTALTLLDLHENKLTHVPAELGALTKLTLLNLSDNLLTDVPAELGNLIALTMLRLQNNQLTHVPAELGRLTALTDLCLQDNRLADVPEELRRLTALNVVLHLQGNLQLLTKLPPKSGTLPAAIKRSRPVGGNHSSASPDAKKAGGPRVGAGGGVVSGEEGGDGVGGEEDGGGVGGGVGCASGAAAAAAGDAGKDGGLSPVPCPRKVCAHCHTRKTTLRRNGPTGPKTLCDACGVRHSFGKLLPPDGVGGGVGRGGVGGGAGGVGVGSRAGRGGVGGGAGGGGVGGEEGGGGVDGEAIPRNRRLDATLKAGLDLGTHSSSHTLTTSHQTVDDLMR